MASLSLCLSIHRSEFRRRSSIHPTFFSRGEESQDAAAIPLKLTSSVQYFNDFQKCLILYPLFLPRLHFTQPIRHVDLQNGALLLSPPHRRCHLSTIPSSDARNPATYLTRWKKYDLGEDGAERVSAGGGVKTCVSFVNWTR